MSGLYVLPAEAFTPTVIAIVIAALIGGAFWAIRQYTKYNKKNGLSREDNPYGLNYAFGTLVAIGLAGAIAFGVDVWAVTKFVDPLAESWIFCVVGVILAFFIAGILIKVIHEGIGAGLDWVAQGVKDTTKGVTDLSSDVADLKIAVSGLVEAIKSITPRDPNQPQ